MNSIEEISEKIEKKEVTRRQFLNYTLMGVGGFMGAALIAPMVRFAVDPATKMTSSSKMISTGLKVSELTAKPQRVDFKVKVQDGWYETEETRTAWVYKEKEEIVALSPICKHLGCTVDWNGNKDFENQFSCPCHGGRYLKNGKNIPKTPPTAPLDIYEQKVKDGILMLGQRRPNQV